MVAREQGGRELAACDLGLLIRMRAIKCRLLSDVLTIHSHSLLTLCFMVNESCSEDRMGYDGRFETVT